MKRRWFLIAVFLLAAEIAGGCVAGREYLQRQARTERHLTTASAEEVLASADYRMTGEIPAQETSHTEVVSETAAETETPVTDPPQTEPVTTNSTETNRVDETQEPDLSNMKVYMDPENFTYGGQKVPVGFCSSSSNYSTERTAWEAVDGDLTTSWQEGVTGPGIGEWMEVDFDGAYPVQYITIHSGNWNDKKGWDYYYKNNYRPKTIEMTLLDESRNWTLTISLPDDHKEHIVSFSEPFPLEGIRITILEVYTDREGETLADETCIAEIGVYY
ncbi:MAG: discoidin domain-containing protein [Candidatus Choladocola sp.]|nr:discoidin domain-containing protein [Candidatus Choladocola sp.]